MTPRFDYFRASPKSVQALFALQTHVNESGLDHTLLHLVKMRASQLNGCAYCLDMHSKDAFAAGETPQRLLLLDAWRETSLYSERERAALEWTESLTLISENHVPDEVFEAVRKHFTEEELVKLTLAVAAINAWNRLAISFRAPAGTYRPGMFKQGPTTSAVRASA